VHRDCNNQNNTECPWPRNTILPQEPKPESSIPEEGMFNNVGE